MKETQLIMGMPITIQVSDIGKEFLVKKAIQSAFDYFRYVDETFSTYKKSSEITKINNGLLVPASWSDDMKTIFTLAEETKQATNGYFNITIPEGGIDPSGIVKGWSIHKAAELLVHAGVDNFCIDAGGDIEVRGEKNKDEPWIIGIRNPFDTEKIVKTVSLRDKGIATSGTYIRGDHIYNPHTKERKTDELASITVIASDVYEADRFATAAFAMGKKGILFLEQKEGLEGYMITYDGIATMTSGFPLYAISA